MEKKKGISILIVVLIVVCVATIACSLSGTSSSNTPDSTRVPPAAPTTSPPTPTPLVLSQMQLNLQVGEVYQIRMISDQKVTQNLDGETQVTSQTFGYGYSYTVTDVDEDGNIWLDALYTWALFEQDGPLGTVSYDSANPPEVVPDAAIGFHGLVGNGFSLKFSPDGLILEIAGLDEMYAGVIDEMGFTDDAVRAQMEQLMQEQFGEEALSEQLNNLVLQLPEESLLIGDTWTVTADSSAIVPMVVETTYTLLSIDGDIATIDVSSVITPDPDGGLMDFGAFQISYSLNGDQEGFTEVDVSTGLTMNFALNQSMFGEMVMYMDGEELSVPSTIEATTTIEAIKD